MKIVGDAPEWAIELVKQVCKDYNRALPGELKWSNTSYPLSSGTTSYCKTTTGKPIYHRKKTGRLIVFRGKISMVAGTQEENQKLVLLHELAHWIVTRSKGMGHNNRFWHKAFELYERYGVDRMYAFDGEKNYRKQAITVFQKLYPEEGLA